VKGFQRFFYFDDLALVHVGGNTIPMDGVIGIVHALAEVDQQLHLGSFNTCVSEKTRPLSLTDTKCVPT